MILPLLCICLGTVNVEIQEQSSLTIAEEKAPTVFHQLAESTFYYYVGATLETASILARLGWGLSYLSPHVYGVGKECLFISQLFDTSAKHVFSRASKKSTAFEKIPLSQKSWYLNQKMLSQIPASSSEDEKLLHFLEKRWLAKTTGFFSSMIDWICPCFGISLQVHPETTGCCYARSPSIKLSQTYIKRVDDWKKSLPQPKEFPLILTRPYNIQQYLPFTIEVFPSEKLESVIEKACLKQTDGPILIDLTQILDEKDPQKWSAAWEACSKTFSRACEEKNLDLQKIICIQRCRQGAIGGIRLLPLLGQQTEQQDQFLLGWISNFGLSANFIELDRWNLIPEKSPSVKGSPSLSKDEFTTFLNAFVWKSEHPQKSLMVEGTLKVLKTLFDQLTPGKWHEILQSPTRASVAHLCFLRIKDELQLLAKDKDAPFFTTAGYLEQIHANLSALLEIVSPFNVADFSPIYRNLLTSIPPTLQSMTSYGIHSSGMTSVCGIFKAVEKSLGKVPKVFYGENTYFECINAAHLVSNAMPIEEAQQEDWKHVDLILAQFNPVLKKVDIPITVYQTEKIANVLHKTFNARRDKPLTLALDCTLDFIDSSRVSRLLKEFEEEIRTGILNIICYRSGLKFDLFGMDNYCGAPFYMIHSQDQKWNSFDLLMSDPALQSDHLSLNWFCLAYQNAASYLEQYRKQVFDNTRALLSKIPSRLMNDNSRYRIIPVKEDADPAFIDIKISGPFHQLRGSALIGGCLSIKCMEGGQPIFYRPSLGLYHPNFTMIFSEERTTIRLTLGLDPAQIDVLADCLYMVDSLNDSSPF